MSVIDAMTAIILPSTFPEFAILLLIGGGLVVMASLVRFLYPPKSVPRNHHLIVCIAPKEIADYLLGEADE